MADAMEEQFKEILTCLICNEVLTKPRTLPCMHTYCAKCLDKLHKTTEEGDTLKCPECQQVHPVPENGVEHIEVNSTTNNLVDIIHDLDAKSKPLCSTCLNMHKKETIASIKCEECDKKFCENCRCFHDEFFQDHCVKNLNDETEYIKKALEKVKESDIYCSKHPGNILEIYCRVDSSILCSECYSADHLNHDTVKIPAIAATKRQELENVLQHGQNRISTLENSIQSSLQNKQAFELHVIDTTNELTNDMNITIQAIRDKYTELINMVEKSKQQRAKQYHAHIRNLEHWKTTAESQMRHLRMIHQHGHDTELVSMATDINLKLKDWTDPVQTNLDMECDKLKFDPSEICEDKVIFGKVDIGNMARRSPKIQPRELIEPKIR
ncbi:unnamed protein product [Owenia fusiformis]|uniref:Uncharacterized protein n=1 Tax=Owenia fusiformis TaxID=6347 RepID=A0A8J1UL76_OWEFU|nr:unnamed protein product [Owenia fusiformis]